MGYVLLLGAVFLVRCYYSASVLLYASFMAAHRRTAYQASAALDVTKMPVFGSTKSAAPPPKPPAAARRKSDAGADLLWQAQLNADAKRQDALAKKPAEPHRGPTSGGGSSR